jgi:FkbM family methyltransferase
MVIKPILKSIFHFSLDMVFTRRQQIRFGRHILWRAKGEGNGNPQTNGEYQLLRTIKNKIHGRKAVFFDVGANVGKWTLIAASDVEDNLSVYAFEPSHQTFRKLQNFIAESTFRAKVIPVNAALSDREGTDSLYVCGELGGTSSLHKRYFRTSDDLRKGIEKVVVTRGDMFCQEVGINHLDFVKIDTEGHEMAVLYGFEDMISEGNIDYIQFEYGGTWIDARNFLFDAFEFLLSNDYKIGKVYPKGLEFYDNYNEQLETFAYANYLAIRKKLAKEFCGIKYV